MTAYFCDSSALVKRYVSETGTAWVRAITASSAGNEIVIAEITPVEILSAIMRRKHYGTLPIRTAQAARLYLERPVRREYHLLRLSGHVLTAAKDLLEKYPLRGYDAVQLASALLVHQALVMAGLPAITFVCADGDLNKAAQAEGLTTDNPSVHS